MANASGKITVYYDGLCRVCSREIEHYKRCGGSEDLNFVDITRLDFDAQAEGLDPQAVHRFLHVRRRDGSVIAGVEAFVQIWSALPRYQWAARLAKIAIVRYGLEGFYRIFVRIRPFLPRKKADCAASPYCGT